MENLIETVDKFTMISITDLFNGLCFTKEKKATEEAEETYTENGLDEIEKQFKTIELTETNSEKMYRLFGSDEEDSEYCSDRTEHPDDSGKYDDYI